MTTAAACESCGMPIETGRYCSYCTDETGALARMPPGQADELIAGLRALVDLAAPIQECP